MTNLVADFWGLSETEIFRALPLSYTLHVGSAAGFEPTTTSLEVK